MAEHSRFDDSGKFKPGPVQSYTERKEALDEKGIKQLSVLLNKGDQELMKQICEILTCNRTDGIRTAIRVYHAILTQQRR